MTSECPFLEYWILGTRFLAFGAKKRHKKCHFGIFSVNNIGDNVKTVESDISFFAFLNDPWKRFRDLETCISFALLHQNNSRWAVVSHSSVLELRKNQFLKKINVLKTFLEIETTHYLEGLDLKLNNETYAKVPNL